MYWTDLPGSELMSRIFSQPPEIGEIDLFNIEIKRDGPTVTINFDMIDTLPDQTPPKWGKEFNRCRIGIYCFGVSDFAVSGISTEMRAKIKFELSNKEKIIRIESDSININISCAYISLTGPSVYLRK